MLSASQVLLFMCVETALRSHKETQLAEEVNAELMAGAAQRAAVSAANRSRAETGRGGRPARYYAIEIEPGGVTYCLGAKAAHVELTKAVMEYGNKFVPTAASLAVNFSRGGWHTLAETLNGTVSIAARNVTDKELAALLAAQNT